MFPDKRSPRSEKPAPHSWRAAPVVCTWRKPAQQQRPGTRATETPGLLGPGPQLCAPPLRAPEGRGLPAGATRPPRACGPATRRTRRLGASVMTEQRPRTDRAAQSHVEPPALSTLLLATGRAVGQRLCLRVSPDLSQRTEQKARAAQGLRFRSTYEKSGKAPVHVQPVTPEHCLQRRPVQTRAEGAAPGLQSGSGARPSPAVLRASAGRKESRSSQKSQRLGRRDPHPRSSLQDCAGPWTFLKGKVGITSVNR